MGSKLLKAHVEHVEPVLMQGHHIPIICYKAQIQTPVPLLDSSLAFPDAQQTPILWHPGVNPLNHTSNYNFKGV